MKGHLFCFILFNFVETPRKFIIAELSIGKLGSSLRIESSAIINLRGVNSTKLDKYFIFTMQTYKELILFQFQFIEIISPQA